MLKMVQNIINDFINVPSSEFQRHAFMPYLAKDFFENPDFYNEFYEILADNESKKVLEWYLKVRMAETIYDTHRSRSEYPPKYSVEDFDSLIDQIDPLITNHISDHPRDLIEVWVLESYRIPGVFEVKPGETVIDGGAFTGNSAIWLSNYVGKEGKIYSFEASKKNYDKLKINIENRNLENVEAVNYALSSQDAELNFMDDGLSAKIDDKGEIKVQGIQLDSFVNQYGIDRIDVIKLDVEGAEEEVLLGAKKVISEFKPKLAISAYHKQDDLFKLVKIIYELNPNYKFYLRAETKDDYNIILFCINDEDLTTKELSFDYKPLIEQEYLDYFSNIINAKVELIQKFLNDKRNAVSEVERLRIQREKLIASLNNLNQDYKLQIKENEHKKNIISDSICENKEYAKNREITNNKINDLNEQIDQANEEVMLLRVQRDQANREVVRLRGQRDQANEEVVRLRSQRDQANEEVVRLRSQRDHANIEISKLLSEQKNSISEIKQLNSIISSKDKKIGVLTSDNLFYNESCESFEEMLASRNEELSKVRRSLEESKIQLNTYQEMGISQLLLKKLKQRK